MDKEREIVCPKCKSSLINITDLDDKIIYSCKNNNPDELFCNWEEFEAKDNYKRKKEDEEPFLSTFLFKEFEDVNFNYNHYYLMSEFLNIKKITKLAKDKKLKDAIIQELSEKYPEWKSNPLKNFYNFLKKDFQERDLNFNPVELQNKEVSDYSLIFSNFIPTTKFISKFNSKKIRKEIISCLLTKIFENCCDITNIFIFTKNFFKENHLIPLLEEIIQVHNEMKGDKKARLKLKNVFIVPQFTNQFFSENGIDSQLTFILHFVYSNKDYFYDKTTIVEKSFWKKWEYGSRNSPYNPYGKDPGAFWIRTSMSSPFQEKIEGKVFKEKLRIIGNSGQEKFQYEPLSIREAIARCLLLGSPVKSNVLDIQITPNELFNSLSEDFQDVAKTLYRRLITKKITL